MGGLVGSAIGAGALACGFGTAVAEGAVLAVFGIRLSYCTVAGGALGGVIGGLSSKEIELSDP